MINLLCLIFLSCPVDIESLLNEAGVPVSGEIYNMSVEYYPERKMCGEPQVATK